jgi:transposase
MTQKQTIKIGGNGTEEKADPEVVAVAKRRRLTAGYKLRILKEADECSGSGEIGALLRREGLYSSHLSRWRKEREQGQLEALAGRKQRRKSKSDLEKEMAGLRQENERVKARLEQAETIIEIQKKLSGLLGLSMPKAESTDRE